MGCHHAQDGLLIVSHDFGTEGSDAIMPKMVLIVYDDVRMPSCPRWSFNCVPWYGTGGCEAIMPKMVLLYPMISGCHHAQDGLLIVSHDFGTEGSDAIMPKMVLIVYDDVRMPSCPRWSFNCVPWYGTGGCEAIMPKMVLLYPMISGCHHAQDGLLIDPDDIRMP